MEVISKHQLFCIIVLFGIGSTTLFALGIKAKQDAWIAILLAMLNGFILLWIFTELQRNFPSKNLVEIIIALLGKTLGFPLAFIYSFYFLESSAINFSEFGFLISITFLQETPLFVINILFMLLILYFLYIGLEVICRTGEIMMPVIIFFLIGTFIMTFISGLFDIKSLEPVLGNGIKPVLDVVYPEILIFPFGETVLFLMYWKHVNSKNLIRKTSIMAMGLFGIIVTCSTLIIISVLGVDYASIATVPLLEVIKTINIGELLTNMYAIAVVIIFIGGFYKTLLNLLGGLLGFSALFNIKVKYIILPACVLTLWIAMSTIPSLMFHRFIGMQIFNKSIHVIFEVVLPILLYLIFLLKKYSSNNKDLVNQQ